MRIPASDYHAFRSQSHKLRDATFADWLERLKNRRRLYPRLHPCFLIADVAEALWAYLEKMYARLEYGGVPARNKKARATLLSRRRAERTNKYAKPRLLSKA